MKLNATRVVTLFVCALITGIGLSIVFDADSPGVEEDADSHAPSSAKAGGAASDPPADTGTAEATGAESSQSTIDSPDGGNGTFSDPEELLLKGAVLLAEREQPLDDGRSVRTRLMRTDNFKYPLLRVVDSLDASGGVIEGERSIAVADQFILKKAEALDRATLEEELNRLNMRIRREMLAPDTYLVAFSPMADVRQLLGLYDVKQFELQRLGHPEPDYILYISSTLPNDPGIQATWGLRNVEHQLELTEVSPAQTYTESGKILFSGALPQAGISGTVVDCGVGDVGEFPAAVSGNLALIRRGANSFKLMAERAADAGAVAVIVANNEAGGFSGTIGDFGGHLPFMTVTQAEGNAILAQSPTAAAMTPLPTDRDIDAENAWDINRGSRDVVVAVIDTGIDYDHEDLAPNMWKNPGETGVDDEGNRKETNGIDDDGNGLIDDVYGYDFYNNDGDPMDDHMHGTHTGGTIGATGNNGVGVVGVNWQVSLMGIKFLNAGGAGAASDAVDSVYYAVQQGVDLTSNSYGGGGFLQAMTDAIEAAGEAGQLFIAAAGNDATAAPQFPASYENENIISVAAIDLNDNLASFSNFGIPHVDIGAPGVAVVSTVPKAWKASGYLSVNGTSMATPHVAGVAALLKSHVPSLPHLEARQRILDSAVPIPSLSGMVATGARLNAFKVLDGISEEPSYAIASIEVDDTSSGNGDGVLNPGETASLLLTVTNRGYSDATSVSAEITGSDAALSFSDNSAAFGNIAGRSEAAALDAFVVTANPSATSGGFLSFTLQFTDAAANTFELPADLYVSDTYTLSGNAELDGVGAEGIDITIEGVLSGSTSTDSSGNWTANVGEGDYTVFASYLGTELSRTEEQAATTPGDVSGIDFNLTTATIGGTVLNRATQAPVPGATLAFRGSFDFTLTTDADGQFSRTDVYGRDVEWTFRASHPDYDFDASEVSVTLPPSQMDLMVEMGEPELDFSATAIQKRLTAGATGSETITLQNVGAADLEWSASIIVNADEANAGALLQQWPQPSSFFSNTNTPPYNGAFDGQYLYFQSPVATSARLFRFDRNDGSHVVMELSELVPTARSSWRLVGHDGAFFWFSDLIEDAADTNLDHMVLYQVDMEAGVVVRRVEVDRNVLYNGAPEGNNIQRARLSARTVGAGSAWLIWQRWDVPAGTLPYSVWVAEVDLIDGSVHNVFQLPDDVYMISQNGSDIAYLTATAGDLAYMNGSLWASRSIFKPISGPNIPMDQRVVLKLDSRDGSILRTITVPGFDDTEDSRADSIVADDTGALWVWENSLDEIAAVHSGEMLWAQVAPIGGSTSAGADESIQVDFKTEFAKPGLNHGAIRFDTNDRDRRTFYLPVSLYLGANQAGNHAPAIDAYSPLTDPVLPETDAQAFSITAADANEDPLSYTWVRNGLIIDGETNNTWNWQTGYDDAGSHAVVASAEDGQGGFALTDWQVAVDNTNRPPVVESGTGVLANNETLDIALDAHDPDGDALEYFIVDHPGQGSVVVTDGAATYTPEAGYIGSDSFTFKANDGQADSNIGTITLTVGTRRLTVDTTELEAAVEVDQATTRTIVLENTGTLPVRWASPMESLTPTQAGEELWRVEEMPIEYSANLASDRRAAALSYDGSDFFVTYSDFSGRQRSDVSRFEIDATDPTSTNELSFHRSSSSGHWIRRMAWDGDSHVTFTDDFVRSFTSNFSYLRDIRLPAPGGYVVDKEMRVVEQTFGPFIGGVAAGWGRHWISAVGSYSGTTFNPGGISILHPDTWEIEKRIDFAEGVGGGASIFWNGALWTGGRGSLSGTDYLSKINPITGEELDRVPYNDSIGIIDMAADSQGRFYYLQLDKLADDDILVARSGDYLRMNPYAGDLQPGETVAIEITLDGESAGPGSHEAILHVISNDPTNPDHEIPVTFSAGVNLPPVIENHTPATPNAQATVKEVTTFAVVATDANAAHADNLTYQWSVDDTPVPQADSPVFGFIASADQVGSRTVSVTVTDPGGLSDSHSWAVMVGDTSFTVTPQASILSGTGPLTVDFFAWVKGSGSDGAYTESDGLVVIEAEDADSIEGGNDSWFLMGDNTDYSGSTALFAVADSEPADWAASDKAYYSIQFTNAGTYYLWMRVQPFVDSSLTSNASFVGLTGSGIPTQSGIFDDENTTEQLVWHRYAQTFAIPGGLTEFSVGAKETAYTIDRILFTQDPNYTPTGRGPNWNSPRIPDSSYTWDLSGTPANGSRATHTFNAAGAHTVEITATSATATATNSLIILVQQLFTDWQAEISWPTGADSSPTGNPDGDRFSNFMEFALGLNPLVADGQNLNTPSVITDEAGDWLAIDYQRNQLAAEVDLQHESSTDLIGWDEVIIDGTNAIETTLDPDVYGDGTVKKMRIQVKMDPATKRLFIRLIGRKKSSGYP